MLRDGDNEIFAFNGEEEDLNDEFEIITITDNSRIDQAPQIDGNQVVWEGKVGTTHEIFLYNIETEETTQITANSNQDRYPQISQFAPLWPCQTTLSPEI